MAHARTGLICQIQGFKDSLSESGCYMIFFYINISKLLKNTEKIYIKNHFKYYQLKNTASNEDPSREYKQWQHQRCSLFK
jgi:hypothetical protein